MGDRVTDVDVIWAENQVRAYKEVYPLYEIYAGILLEILNNAIRTLAPLGIVQSRAKSIASFASKIWRKKDESLNPLINFTDLCGARVITNDLLEVKAVSDYILNHFLVDWENSVDIRERLKPTEFGYRSVHFIVMFKPGIFPNPLVPIEIPLELFGKKAEIQVRTFLEHSFADFSHRVAYKRHYIMPELWQREIGKLAAFLEEADCQLLRVQKGLLHYLSSYSAYMKEDEIKRELKILYNVLLHDPENATLAHEAARLAFELGDWDETIRILSPFKSSNSIPAVLLLGITLCNKYESDKKSVFYLEGQNLIKNVIELDPKNSYALCAMGSTYKNSDELLAAKYYKKAFLVSPDDPYAVSCHLDYAVPESSDLSVIDLLRPVIMQAYQKSRELADASLELPWSYYNMGKFSMLFKEEFLSLNYYAKALSTTHSVWQVTRVIFSLRRYGPLKSIIPGYESILKLLLVGRSIIDSVNYPVSEIPEILPLNLVIKGPVIIITCNNIFKSQIETKELESFIITSFSDYRGSVILHGPINDISEIAKILLKNYKENLVLYKYSSLNSSNFSISDGSISLSLIKETKSFEPEIVISYWADLIASGINPGEVKLIGFSGGEEIEIEYCISLAFGAKVGIIAFTSRGFAPLFRNKDWSQDENLSFIPNDTETLRAYIGSGISEVPFEEREEIAKTIHQNYQTDEWTRLTRHSTESSFLDWDILPESLKSSNRAQAQHIWEKISHIGYKVRQTPKERIKIIEFTNDEVEILAKMEHGRWNAERLLNGWRYGEKKDIVKKENPNIIPWKDLPDTMREYDRNAVRRIPEILASVGFELYEEIEIQI